jgi:hypothetical protein
MDGAARTVAGEEAAMPMTPGADTGLTAPVAPEAGAEVGAEVPPAADAGVEIPRADDMATSDAAAGGTEELGRGKRA